MARRGGVNNKLKLKVKSKAIRQNVRNIGVVFVVFE